MVQILYYSYSLALCQLAPPRVIWHKYIPRWQYWNIHYVCLLPQFSEEVNQVKFFINSLPLLFSGTMPASAPLSHLAQLHTQVEILECPLCRSAALVLRRRQLDQILYPSYSLAVCQLAPPRVIWHKYIPRWQYWNIHFVCLLSLFSEEVNQVKFLIISLPLLFSGSMPVSAPQSHLAQLHTQVAILEYSLCLSAASVLRRS